MKDSDLIARFLSVGNEGLGVGEVCVLLYGHAAATKKDRDRVHNDISRVRKLLSRRGQRLEAVSPHRANVRYRIVTPEAERVAAAPIVIFQSATIPSVRRIVSGDLGLGAEPGAIVSVARLSFLDGAVA